MTWKKYVIDVKKVRHFFTSFFVFSPKILTLILPIFDSFFDVFIVFLRVLSYSTSFEVFCCWNFHVGMLSGNSEMKLIFNNFPVPTGTGFPLPFYVGPGLMTYFSKSTSFEQNVENHVMTWFFHAKKSMFSIFGPAVQGKRSEIVQFRCKTNKQTGTQMDKQTQIAK